MKKRVYKPRAKVRPRDKYVFEFNTIYPGKINVLFSVTAFKTLLQDRNVPWTDGDDLDDTFGFATKYEGIKSGLPEYVLVVNLDRAEEIHEHFESITHEATHIVQYIRRYIETEFDDEAEAYLHGYICKCVLKALTAIQKEESK